MRDKQIEDMASIIHHSDKNYNNIFPSSLNECLYKHGGVRTNAGIALYNAGYRKASDVAREISQDIIEPLWNAYKNSTCQETVLLVALICETINNQLKKKYESEGEG